MKSFFNTISSNKSIILVASALFLIAGSIANSFFILAPMAYLASLALAYAIGGRISNHGLNIAYNWSIKWAVFVVFLYLTTIYLPNVFVYAMFSYILINTTLNPMLFVSQDKAAL